MQHIEKLKQMSACENAIDWAGKYHSLQECREKCERGDWLLWFAGKIGIDRKILVLAACDCAERSLKHVKKGDDRPKIAIETARKWAGGDESVTTEDVRHAAYAAHAAARAAAHAATRAAADAADADELKWSANKVRERISWEMILERMEA